MLGPGGRVLVYGGVRLLVSHLCSRWGEVLVTPGDDSRDEHGWLRRAGTFPFLFILVFFFLGVSSMWVFLHNPHSTSFHGGRVSSFSL